MCRQPPATARQRSQRPLKEVRDLEAKASEAKRKLEVALEEKQVAYRHRNSECASQKRLKEEVEMLTPKSLDGLQHNIGKLTPQSTAFYAHVKFGVDWLKRFELSDVPLLLTTVLKQLGLAKGVDLRWETLMSDGMKTARNALLLGHGEEVALAPAPP